MNNNKYYTIEILPYSGFNLPLITRNTTTFSDINVLLMRGLLPLLKPILTG